MKIFYDYEEVNEFIGGCIEFRFCDTKKPIKFNKDFDYLDEQSMKNGLYSLSENKDFDFYYAKFFKNEKALKEMGVPNNADIFFDIYGVNYYTPKQTQQILNALQDKDLPEVDTITSWLKTCVEKYNGFYIMGV